jgi:hypothetical protein
VKVDLDINKVAGKIQKRLSRSQFALDQQVIKDSNYYAPEDTGELQDSAILGSNLGEVKWDKSYARRQYYEDNDKSKDRNPNASMKWFEVAKSKMLKMWIRIANDKYNK